MSMSIMLGLLSTPATFVARAGGRGGGGYVSTFSGDIFRDGRAGVRYEIGGILYYI